MIKSITFFILFYPLFLNICLILLIMIPSKNNNFHPMTFLIILILLTFLITLKMNLLSTSCISFLLFLTIIGGLMIIFMYITSLTNNELFFLNFKSLPLMITKISLILSLIMFIQFTFPEMNFFSFNLPEWTKYNSFMNMMNYLYLKNYSKSTIYLMIYLYYTMIIIMNICSNNKAPLRQMTHYE